MLFSQIEMFSGASLVCIVVVSMLIGALAMHLRQRAFSWRIRRMLMQNCAACNSPQTDALLMHSHPIKPGNRAALSAAALSSAAARLGRGADTAGRKDK